MGEKILNRYIAGVDEVGRGPLAGPVVACCVLCLVADFDGLGAMLGDSGVRDSKKLSKKKRKEILQFLQIPALVRGKKTFVLNTHRGAFVIGIAEASVAEVDAYNIHRASLLAMARACESAASLCPESHLAQFDFFIDGKYTLQALEYPTLYAKLPQMRCQAIIGGDNSHELIALASIIAKEYRDELMVKLSEHYPEYGWQNHSGYPTKKHKEAIRHYGPSPWHRKTFKGVSEYLSTKRC